LRSASLRIWCISNSPSASQTSQRIVNLFGGDRVWRQQRDKSGPALDRSCS
jgi:hypothetical protein